MADAFLGEIRLFGWSFAPRDWALCNGVVMNINQNTALFSLLGTRYGGNGTTTFGLPNLQGCAVVGAGQGPGLQNWDVGQVEGNDGIALTALEGPVHAHTMSGRPVTLAQGVPVPTATTMFGRLGTNGAINYAYYEADTPTAQTTMSPQMLGVSGSGMPHENRQPFLTMYYCICTNGIFPARP